MKHIFSNALILTEKGFIKGGFEVEGGRFTKIGKSVSGGTDLNGAKVLSGLFDIHTHGANGYDFNTVTGQEQMEKICRYYTSCGATSVLATLLTDNDEVLFRQLELVAKLAKNFPVIRGIHLEGPFLSMEYKGAMPPQYLKNPSIALFEEYQKRAKGLIKLVTIAPELEGAEEFTKYLCKKGVVVSLGHSGADFEQTHRCVQAGAKSFTHIFNAMRPIDHHSGGISSYALYCDKYCEVITDGKHLDKNIVKMLSKIKKNKLIGITDSLSCAGLKDGNYLSGSTPIYVKEGDARIVGTNIRAGSVLNIFDGYKNYIEFCGATEKEAIKIFTKAPATLLSIYKERGSIAQNKYADFIIVEKEKITGTYIEGKVQFSADKQ